MTGLRISVENTQGQQIFVDIGHYLYVYDIAYHFDRYFHAIQNDGKSVDFSHLQKHILPDGTPWVFPSLPEMQEEWCIYGKHGLPKEGNIVLDAGAYSGLTAKWLSRLVGPEGKVISLEPDLYSFQALKQNIVSYPNIIPHQLALSDKVEELSFCHHGNQGSSFTYIKNQPSRKENVKTTTFDELEGLYGKFDWCKIDIEGAEEKLWTEILKRRCVVEVHNHDSPIFRLNCGDIKTEKAWNVMYLFTRMEVQ